MSGRCCCRRSRRRLGCGARLSPRCSRPARLLRARHLQRRPALRTALHQRRRAGRRRHVRRRAPRWPPPVAGGGPRAAPAARNRTAGLFGAGSGAAYALNCKIWQPPLFAGWNDATDSCRGALARGAGGPRSSAAAAAARCARWGSGSAASRSRSRCSCDALAGRRSPLRAAAAAAAARRGAARARRWRLGGRRACGSHRHRGAPCSRWCVFLAGSLPGLARPRRRHPPSRAAAPRRAALTSLGVSVFAGGSLAGRLAGGALIDRVEVRAGAVGTSGGEAACFRRAEGLAPRDLTGSRALAGA